MSRVLVLTSSVLGEASVSNQLVAEAVAQLRLQDPGAEIVTRDLVGSPVPHLTPNSAAALRGGEPANAEQAAAIKLSDELIGELKAADIIVIGAPMYNFGIASSLKAWFDYALRAGVTFRYSEAGPEGLVLGKRAIIIETRGGFYSEGAMQSFDSQEPHLRNLLGFIGITDVTFVRAEKLAFGPQAREQAIKAARVHIGQTVQDQLFQAA
ncbi:NAD(P)H-dependent oxidoreductase [Mesorhizobium sp. RMAD-H1]|uniref:FMN-dependent NADH-azoreductase n=1 Tax=Mesorhizobium sp. RMAD-H1 TaxID=2587065 RepID=UPI00161C7E43|nr:NAD(P)H-dependent oxidoreductase [Mesorhizobium sp. RMAD-H1]MBB2974026.1 FMN-dependent NADH-azoreductase [Mesorhizobium sp. RMAD-H1]